MTINLLPYSRFAITDPIIIDGQETFGLFKRFSFLNKQNLNEDQIFKFVVQPPFHGRPDLIAEEIYEASILDWVIIMFNNPRETLSWPPNGSVIQYPSPTLVFAEIR